MRTTKKTTKPSTTKITTTKAPMSTPNPRAKWTTKTPMSTIYSTVVITTVTMPSTTTTTKPPPKPFEVNFLPDKQFWNNLKQLYYYGCNNPKVEPVLCQTLNNSVQYSDLTQFELPETNDFKHMDQNLLVHLIQAEQTLNLRPDIDLNIENLFPFILYGIDKLSDDKQMPSTMENGYRFVLCLYIDTILLDKNLNLSFVQNPPTDDENVTQKLKYFLVRIASKFLTNYHHALRVLENSNDYVVKLNEPSTMATNQSFKNNSKSIQNANNILNTAQTMTSEYMENPITSMELQTISVESDEQLLNFSKNIVSEKSKNNLDLIVESEPVDESCHLESLPETSPNSYIREVKIDNETIFNKPDRLYLIGPVSVRTRAYLACSEGFRSTKNSVQYFECSESFKWVGEPIHCEGDSSLMLIKFII